MANANSPPSPENLIDIVFSYDNTLMLAAIISLLIIILFVLLLHLYARWFLTRHPNLRPVRRQQLSMTFTTFEIPPTTKETGCDGLDSTTIESIPTFLYKNEDAAMECSICLSEFEEREVGRKLPRCSHAFHVECIDTWLRVHRTCPVCRLDVVLPLGLVGRSGDFDKDDDCPKDDVVLEINDDESDFDPVELSSESATLERLMRLAMSRSCRSEVVSNNLRLEQPRPSI